MATSHADVKSIFGRAMEIDSGADRDAFLDLACGRGHGLRAEVGDLLAAAGRAGEFLCSPAVLIANDRTSDYASSVETPGSTIGSYKLLEQIGEGGMGTVFMAAQSQPVRRKVALKIIKPGMDSKQVITRFEAERQALAMMDHPNIARVIDAGTTSAGRPFFVMELVRGIPVTEYCDRKRLSIPERLELFVLVCRAVQHAHQKGIIHRDLKPSNILVTEIDGSPVPKVIDFGVAKATGARLTDQSLYTGFHQMLGTPAYMSPEQVDLAGADVDTRSDVYSLGVLLYQMLTGTTPFDSKTLTQASFDEMRRIIRETEPPTPSTRLNSLGDELTTVSTHRKIEPRQLHRCIRGELDWITMKALEKERRRRYQTASDFAADVMRQLNDLPVEACPISVWYRFKKYLRRNVVALSAATLVAVALIGGIVASLWQAGLARGAERRAAADAAVANAIAAFLQEDLLKQATSTESRRGQDLDANPDLTVREALDRASSRIGDRFRDQPLVEAAIRTTIGDAYCNLVHRRAALPHFERALDLRRTHLGNTHPDTRSSMSDLAGTYSWTGSFAQAIALRKDLLEISARELGSDHPETLFRIGQLASDYNFAGNTSLSVPLWEDLLERERTVLGPVHVRTLDTMHMLAAAYDATGRTVESRAMFEKLLELLNANNGPRHATTIWVRRRFAQHLLRAGDLNAAAALLRETLEIERSLPDSSAVMRQRGTANTQGWLALTLVLQKRYAEAEPLARDSESTFARIRADDDTRRFYWMSVRGAALCGLQRYAEAEPRLVQSYVEMKKREAERPQFDQRERAEVGERVIEFYHATNQPAKVRAWRQLIQANQIPSDDLLKPSIPP